MTDAPNPYAAPSSDLSTPGSGLSSHARAVEIRKEHLRHEASIQGAGSLNLLTGIVLTLAVFAPLVASGEELIMNDSPAWLAFMAGFGLLHLAAGYNLRKLHPRARTIGTLAWIPALLSIPVGTVIGIYVQYLLHSKKGQTILTEEYAEIRKQTPEIKYRSWLVIIVLLLFFLALIGAAFVVASSG